MKAVLLAAGSSTRLYPLTRDAPKCLLEVGGQTLLEHQLDALAACDVDEVVVVTGYLEHLIAAKIEAVQASYPFKFSSRSNPRYASTNNLYSLSAAKELLSGQEFLCLHADVLFHPQILRAGAQAQDDVCLVADRAVLEETMKLKTRGDEVIEIGKHVTMAEASGTFLGIAKFSAEGSRRMFAEVEALVTKNETDVYFTRAIEYLIKRGFRVGAAFTEGLAWIEIDFAEELAQARSTVYKEIAATRA